MVGSAVSRGDVEAALRVLSRREEEVLRLRFGIGEHSHDRTEVGLRVGIARSRVRQIESKAFQRLRQASLLEFSEIEMEGVKREPLTRPTCGDAPRSRANRYEDIGHRRGAGRPQSAEPPRPYGENDPYPVNSVGWDEV
jgi:hypothetical protein